MTLTPEAKATLGAIAVESLPAFEANEPIHARLCRIRDLLDQVIAGPDDFRFARTPLRQACGLLLSACFTLDRTFAKDDDDA